MPKVVQIYGNYIPTQVLVKKELELASILYNCNIVNAREVIDDPDHDTI